MYDKPSWYRRGVVMIAALAIALIGLGLGPAGYGAAAASADSTLRPVRQCADLVRGFHVPGAPTQVTSAREMGGAGTTEPRHCLVVGHVEPAVEFQLKLPL